MTKYLLTHISYDTNTHNTFDTIESAITTMKNDYDFTIKDCENYIQVTDIVTEGVPMAYIVWDDNLFDSWNIVEITTEETDIKVTEPFIS